MAPPEVIGLSVGSLRCLATLSVKDVEDMFVFLDESTSAPPEAGRMSPSAATLHL